MTRETVTLRDIYGALPDRPPGVSCVVVGKWLNIRTSYARRGLMRLVGLENVRRQADAGIAVTYWRDASVLTPREIDEIVPAEPPKGTKEKLGAGGKVEADVINAARKPYESVCPGPLTQREPLDRELFAKAARQDAAIAQSRNRYVNAALDRADQVCAGIVGASDSHREAVLRIEAVALRDAADMLDRRLEIAARAAAAPSTASRSPSPTQSVGEDHVARVPPSPSGGGGGPPKAVEGAATAPCSP
ncbi:MAG TPA: hypothetical protein VNX86_04600 [Rhizomicrobium sp.]|jgi:hypothetical protein|nr:hypothetical protein [Rhizomicrobium sp.]